METEKRVREIRRKMAGLRRDLDEDVNEIVENVGELTGLRYYMRQYPWAMLGAATFLGYWVVPSRNEIHNTDPKTLEKLAARHKLVVKDQTEPEKRGGVLGGIFSFLSTVVLRGAMAYAGAKVSEMFDDTGSGNDSRAGSRTTRPHAAAKSTAPSRPEQETENY